MILIHCPHCDADHLVGYRSLVEVQNTEHGPVAFARCPETPDLPKHRTSRNTGPTDPAPLLEL